MDPSVVEQALAGLRDIHSPAAPGFWPLAPGWWVLITLAVVLPLIAWFLTARYKKARKRSLVKRLALAELTQMQDAWHVSKSVDHASAPSTMAQLALLLRRAAVQKFGAAAVAELSGDAWLAFIASQASSVDLGEQKRWFTDQRFSRQQASEDDVDACFLHVHAWLRAAL